MFGYLLLLAELAVLGLLYWYFRVRKEPTYQIEGDPWGSYTSKRKCGSKFSKIQERCEARTAKSGNHKRKGSPIVIHQSRRYGWTFSEKERRMLQEITGVHLDITTSHVIEDADD
jgi:hypothetical protein